jgi:hypothetical protein
MNYGFYHKFYQKLFELLPGPVIKIMISSKPPDQIIDMFDQIVKTGKTEWNQVVLPGATVCLINADVWWYSDHSEIFDHLFLQDKLVFNVTLGYENKKIKDNVWKISWPLYYFSMISKHNPQPVKTTCNYGISCLNNRPTLHRLLLGYNFYKNNLLDDIIFSQNNTPWIRGGRDLEYLEKIQDFDIYQNLLPITYQEPPTDYQMFVNVGLSINHPAYIDAFCNIVTESEIETGLQITTEKTFKPFISAQVPVFYSCPGHLLYLKELGFEVMENIIPGGYDHLLMEERIQKIIWLVKQGKRYIEDFYAQHIREIQHNLELMYSSDVEKKIISNIQNVISI